MKIADLPRMRWLLGTLLIVAAALFAIGVATEGDAHHETVASVEAGAHNEATEAGAHNERAATSETSETILGVNLESRPLVSLAVILSIVLAAATWRTDRKLILLVTALFAAAFAALDLAEVSHQIQVSAAAIAVVAGVIAALHAAAALLAEQRRARDLVTERKALVRRLVDEVMNGNNLEVLDELCSSKLAPKLRTAFT